MAASDKGSSKRQLIVEVSTEPNMPNSLNSLTEHAPVIPVNEFHSNAHRRKFKSHSLSNGSLSDDLCLSSNKPSCALSLLRLLGLSRPVVGLSSTTPKGFQPTRLKVSLTVALPSSDARLS